jgi:hypothetical protein
MRRALGIGGCVVAAVGLAGCYGSTEPATDVTETRATLNAKGVANNGPAYAFFEFWRTANPGVTFRTGRVRLPGGANAPFAQQVAFLAPARAYSFRLCGGDEANPAEPVCAQTRSFTTSTPTGDVASGSMRLGGPGPGINVNFEASSGPSGENPSGYAHGNVTCLSVSGNQATIGSTSASGEGVLIWATEDPPGSGSGRVVFSSAEPAPVDCSTPPGGGVGTTIAGFSNHVAVYDTPGGGPGARR